MSAREYAEAALAGNAAIVGVLDGDARVVGHLPSPTEVALARAVLAVLDLHECERPNHDPRDGNCTLNRGVKWLGARCRVCDKTVTLMCSCGKPQPCSTVRAIEEALGG